MMQAMCKKDMGEGTAAAELLLLLFEIFSSHDGLWPMREK